MQEWWAGFCEEFYINFIKKDRWKYLTNGLGRTLEITLLAVLVGIALGFLVAIIRSTHEKTGKLKIGNAICQVYLTVIRGTPMVVQLMIMYFIIFLPLGVSKMVTAVLAFGINSGAYVAEIVRGGIMSVDNGQLEAGRSLGFGYARSMWYIVIPQAFKAVLPALANEFIVLLKETSVCSFIGLNDLTRGGDIIRGVTYSDFMPLIAVALIYLVMVVVLSYFVKLLERRLRKSDH
ncbi:MAG: amino acid ABC transporter permease [Firmicutes bacterium]|nr:amino acid ABC transporter permease [Bacillota bacterium]